VKVKFEYKKNYIKPVNSLTDMNTVPICILYRRLTGMH